MKNSNLRFVHHQEEFGSYSGITIAYERTDTNVFFAYALCCKPDQYQKSVGRDRSTATYLKHMDEIHSDIDYVDYDKRVGCVPIHVWRDALRQSVVSGVFADQLLDRLTTLDLKHAFISHMLVDFICHSGDE